jgi:acyl-CoA hydrolase
LHFVARVHVACPLRNEDTVREQFPRLFDLSEARQELAKLEVAGDIFRMGLEEFAEVLSGGFVVPQLHALEGQSVTGKRVTRLLGDELLENFAARLLHLGHRMNARIIAASAIHAKSLHHPSGDPGTRMPKPTNKHASSKAQPELESKPAGRPASASSSEMVEAVLPNDANALGNMLGGRVMHLIDIAGALAAHRHSMSHVVTASVDYLDFRSPIRVGEFIILKSSVNRAFRTSMEVGVKVFSENILTGERKHTSSAYLTYVAIDLDGQPHPVPPLVPETEDDRRRYGEAGERRRLRLATRHKGLLAQP